MKQADDDAAARELAETESGFFKDVAGELVSLQSIIEAGDPAIDPDSVDAYGLTASMVYLKKMLKEQSSAGVLDTIVGLVNSIHDLAEKPVQDEASKGHALKLITRAIKLFRHEADVAGRSKAVDGIIPSSTDGEAADDDKELQAVLSVLPENPSEKDIHEAVLRLKNTGLHMKKRALESEIKKHLDRQVEAKAVLGSLPEGSPEDAEVSLAKSPHAHAALDKVVKALAKAPDNRGLAVEADGHAKDSMELLSLLLSGDTEAVAKDKRWDTADKVKEAVTKIQKFAHAAQGAGLLTQVQAQLANNLLTQLYGKVEGEETGSDEIVQAARKVAGGASHDTALLGAHGNKLLAELTATDVAAKDILEENEELISKASSMVASGSHELDRAENPKVRRYLKDLADSSAELKQDKKKAVEALREVDKAIAAGDSSEEMLNERAKIAEDSDRLDAALVRSTAELDSLRTNRDALVTKATGHHAKKVEKLRDKMDTLYSAKEDLERAAPTGDRGADLTSAIAHFEQEISKTNDSLRSLGETPETTDAQGKRMSRVKAGWTGKGDTEMRIKERVGQEGTADAGIESRRLFYPHVPVEMFLELWRQRGREDGSHTLTAQNFKKVAEEMWVKFRKDLLARHSVRVVEGAKDPTTGQHIDGELDILKDAKLRARNRAEAWEDYVDELSTEVLPLLANLIRQYTDDVLPGVDETKDAIHELLNKAGAEVDAQPGNFEYDPHGHKQTLDKLKRVNSSIRDRAGKLITRGPQTAKNFREAVGLAEKAKKQLLRVKEMEAKAGEPGGLKHGKNAKRMTHASQQVLSQLSEYLKANIGEDIGEPANDVEGLDKQYNKALSLLGSSLESMDAGKSLPMMQRADELAGELKKKPKTPEEVSAWEEGYKELVDLAGKASRAAGKDISVAPASGDFHKAPMEGKRHPAEIAREVVKQLGIRHKALSGHGAQADLEKAMQNHATSLTKHTEKALHKARAKAEAFINSNKQHDVGDERSSETALRVLTRGMKPAWLDGAITDFVHHEDPVSPEVVNTISKYTDEFFNINPDELEAESLERFNSIKAKLDEFLTAAAGSISARVESHDPEKIPGVLNDLKVLKGSPILKFMLHEWPGRNKENARVIDETVENMVSVAEALFEENKVGDIRKDVLKLMHTGARKDELKAQELADQFTDLYDTFFKPIMKGISKKNKALYVKVENAHEDIRRALSRTDTMPETPEEVTEYIDKLHAGMKDIAQTRTTDYEKDGTPFRTDLQENSKFQNGEPGIELLYENDEDHVHAFLQDFADATEVFDKAGKADEKKVKEIQDFAGKLESSYSGKTSMRPSNVLHGLYEEYQGVRAAKSEEGLEPFLRRYRKNRTLLVTQGKFKKGSTEESMLKEMEAFANMSWKNKDLKDEGGVHPKKLSSKDVAVLKDLADRASALSSEMTYDDEFNEIPLTDNRSFGHKGQSIKFVNAGVKDAIEKLIAEYADNKARLSPALGDEADEESNEQATGLREFMRMAELNYGSPRVKKAAADKEEETHGLYRMNSEGELEDSVEDKHREVAASETFGVGDETDKDYQDAVKAASGSSPSANLKAAMDNFQYLKKKVGTLRDLKKVIPDQKLNPFRDLSSDLISAVGMMKGLMASQGGKLSPVGERKEILQRRVDSLESMEKNDSLTPGQVRSLDVLRQTLHDTETDSASSIKAYTAIISQMEEALDRLVQDANKVISVTDPKTGVAIEQRAKYLQALLQDMVNDFHNWMSKSKAQIRIAREDEDKLASRINASERMLLKIREGFGAKTDKGENTSITEAELNQEKQALFAYIWHELDSTWSKLRRGFENTFRVDHYDWKPLFESLRKELGPLHSNRLTSVVINLSTIMDGFNKPVPSRTKGVAPGTRNPEYHTVLPDEASMQRLKLQRTELFKKMYSFLAKEGEADALRAYIDEIGGGQMITSRDPVKKEELRDMEKDLVKFAEDAGKAYGLGRTLPEIAKNAEEATRGGGVPAVPTAPAIPSGVRTAREYEKDHNFDGSLFQRMLRRLKR